MSETAPNNDQPSVQKKTETGAEAAKNRHRRSSRSGRSKRGRTRVLVMILLVLGFYGLRTYLYLTGEIHPALLWLVMGNPLTANILNLSVTFVGLFCLFLLYRGSLPMRYLFGTISLINILVYLVLLPLNVMDEIQWLWLGFNSFGLILSIYASWVCLICKTAIQFLSSQADRKYA